MRKHLPAAAPAPGREGIRFAPTAFDRAALGIIAGAVKDASGQPFLTSEGAIRYAVGLTVRVLAAGRQAEFTAPPASTLLSKLPAAPGP